MTVHTVCMVASGQTAAYTDLNVNNSSYIMALLGVESRLTFHLGLQALSCGPSIISWQPWIHSPLSAMGAAFPFEGKEEETGIRSDSE